MRRALVQQRRVLKQPTSRRKLEEPRDDKRDAARWQALMSSQSVRVLTTAPSQHSNVAKGAHYIMVEFVSELADPTLGTLLPSKHLLVEYADTIIQEKLR